MKSKSRNKKNKKKKEIIYSSGEMDGWMVLSEKIC